MIIVDGKSPPSQREWPASEQLLVNIGGGSTSLTGIPDGPPPSFTPYAAEFFLDSRNDVVSHDHHLNTDGEALYRFLLSQSHVLPTLRVYLQGSHPETKLRWVNSTDAHGHSITRSEFYTETVTDFDFCIDIHPDHLRTRGQEDAGVHWSVADDEPAFRGRMVRELDSPVSELTFPFISVGSSHRKKATRNDVRRYLEWTRKRRQMGYPPWMRQQEEVNGGMGDGTVSLRSSKTLRQWADEYCASPKYLKEFVYQKVLYGWNFSQLEKSLHSLVLSSPYNGDLKITFTNYSSKIRIRPSNRLSRMLSNKWLKFLSIILLIYPFIWLFKRFHKRGGGIWEVCGGAYPLKQWVPVGREEIIPPEVQEESLPPYDLEGNTWSNPTLTSRGSSSLNPAFINTADLYGSTRYMQTTSGMKKLIGIKEGEWFRNWEGPITRAIIGKYQSSEPLSGAVPIIPAHGLDGYHDDTGTLIS